MWPIKTPSEKTSSWIFPFAKAWVQLEIALTKLFTHFQPLKTCPLLANVISVCQTLWSCWNHCLPPLKC